MSHVIYRDGEPKDYWFSIDQWCLLLETMQLYEWEPRGTLYYSIPPFEWLQWGAQKDAVYTRDMDDLFDRTTPEELAEFGAEHHGLDYDELLRSYSEQWGGETFDIHSHIDLLWAGSYASNDAAYVTAEDALAMSVSLQRAAEDLENDRTIRFPDDWPDGDFRGIKPKYYLQDTDEKNQNPRILEGAEALRTFASWLAKGEFRIC